MNRPVRGRMQCGVGLEERNLRLPDLAILFNYAQFLLYGFESFRGYSKH
ncbi:MAG: hypothetical protein ACI92O_001021 [Colwellia sp.]|jgi:hypothetical protein